MRISLRKVVTATGLATALVASATYAALAVPVDPGTPRSGGLAQIGPLNEYGFPSWYKDTSGVRLEPCITLDDPLCSALPDTLPNPDGAIVFPSNFPEEFFYQLAAAEVTLESGQTVTIGMDLEGAFANGAPADGDQMVFGRIRIRGRDLPAGNQYRFVHPYGADEVTSDDGGVNMTEDIGITPGAFGEVFSSRVGPFLRWDPNVAPAAPAGYVGDPNVNHAVVGSPYGTNHFTVQQRVSGEWTTVGTTDQFSLQGRLATKAGVDLDAATYTVDGSGQGFAEVYATSEPGQALQVQGDPALGFGTTTMRGSGDGHYYARVPVTGGTPDQTGVTVVNASDVPATTKTLDLADVISPATAAYDADTNELTVTATSSDGATDTPPALTVEGMGPLTGGTATFSNLLAPRPTVTVSSSAGGTVTVPVQSTGQAMGTDAPVAAILAPATAVVGQTVQLDGTGSAGTITGWQWTSPSGTTLNGADTANASFVASEPGTVQVQLVVSGPGGGSVPATAGIEVQAESNPVADAGNDLTAQRGTSATLDATGSTSASSFSWRQVMGPGDQQVTLQGADTAKPTFTMPLVNLPAAPGPNSSYTLPSNDLEFEVTASSPSGVTSTDTVVVTARPETISGVTARYRTRGEWRVSGTSSVIANQRVAIVLGSTPTGRVVGFATVDGAGVFSYRGGSSPAPGTVRRVTIISRLGGTTTAPLTVTS